MTFEEHIDKFIDHTLVSNMSEDMSIDFLRSMVKNGADFFKEGFENRLVWGIGKFAESITYQDDKTFRELVTSKEARREAIEEFLQGYLFSFSENG